MSLHNSHCESKPTENVDLREQLFNAGEIGPIEQVQVSKDRITALRGILFDLDPHLLRTDLLIPPFGANAEDLYQNVVKNWLAREPCLAPAEVRCSGTGLHVIIRFGKPVVFADSADRERWTAIVETVQATLPIDPHQPGITAVTRALGSINSKNSETVRQLAPGSAVTPSAVVDLSKRMSVEPFQTVFTIIAGSNRVAPCPVCRGEGSSLTAGRVVGFCYGECEQVSLAQFYDVLLAENGGEKKEISR